jgi:SNF2 family DNA or RNA helicase
MTYKFETEPYDHQREIFNDSWAVKNYALFLEMGTGKTKLAVDTAGALYEAGQIDTVLVIAPKGVYANWTQKEIPIHLPERIERSVLQWQPNFTKKYVKEIRKLATIHTALHWLVMNVEAMSTKKGAAAAHKYLSMNPHNLVIVDESTTVKNRKAQRTKNIVKAGELAKYRRILTGSPITKNPMDLYSQCAFLDDSLLGFKSYYAYQNRYAVVRSRSLGSRAFQEIVGYRRLDELHDKLDRFSARVLKEDCLDLPDKIYQSREVTLTKEQTTAYKQMQELALAQLATGELSTTASVLTQIMRLQEICCGHLRTDDGDIQALPSKRMDEMLDVIDEMLGKVIIWATWVYDIEKIVETLRERYGPESAEGFYGATPQDARQDIVDRFQDPDSDLRFFVGNPKTGGYGLTLTAATNMIYYNNGYDLETRIQSEDRAHRIGQEHHVLYVDLISPGTVDEKILKALRGKIDLAQEVLGEDPRNWIL